MPSMRKLVLFVFLSLSLCEPHLAQAGEALLNSEVDVDVTGSDATDARAKALAKGEVDGLLDLLGKLARPDQAKDIVSRLTGPQVAAIVRGTEVQDEKITDNRYRARLDISYDADAISKLLSKGSAPGEDEAVHHGAYLIIPVYEEQNTTMLWEETNPWRNVWKQTGLEIGGGDIVTAYGDTMDSSLLAAKSADSATFSALAPLTIRYGVTDIVILKATLLREPELTLNVIKRRMNKLDNEVTMLTYRADPQENRDTLLARAARDIAQQLVKRKEQEQEADKGVHGGEKHTVMALAAISTMASWTDLRGKLSHLPMVDSIEMLAISPRQVDMVIHYRGTPESLAEAVEKQHIRLVRSNPSYWVLSRD